MNTADSSSPAMTVPASANPGDSGGMGSKADRPSGPAAGMDPERWVEEHGDYLYHFALSRVRDVVRAEDLVQETLLAALRGVERYEGRSTERTWLAGILRNKLLDHFRKAGRETAFTDLEFYEDEERQAFDHPTFPGHWVAEAGPQDWGKAGENLDQDAFWEAFHDCTRKLPERVARVFILRELDELTTEEICASLHVTPNNLWVMLHRARMALRRCLEENWFLKHGHDLP